VTAAGGVACVDALFVTCLVWLGSHTHTPPQVEYELDDAWAGLLDKCLETREPQFTYK
jgi:hypothetical protein